MTSRVQLVVVALLAALFVTVLNNVALARLTAPQTSARVQSPELTSTEAKLVLQREARVLASGELDADARAAAVAASMTAYQVNLVSFFRFILAITTLL